MEQELAHQHLTFFVDLYLLLTKNGVVIWL